MIPQDFAKSADTGAHIDGRLKVATANLFLMRRDLHVAKSGAR
jgi:hypothetical protein